MNDEQQWLDNLTTENVRGAFAEVDRGMTYYQEIEECPKHLAAFDRWFAEEIRKAKREALNEAADVCWEGYEHTDNRGVSIWLRNRARDITEAS